MKDLNTIPISSVDSGSVDVSQVIVTGDQVQMERILDLAIEHNVRHFVQDSCVCREKELAFSSLMQESPKQFFSYPISTILTPEHSGGESERQLCFYDQSVSSSTRTPEMLDEIGMLIKASHSSENLARDCISIADELLSNFVALSAKRSDGSAGESSDSSLRLFIGWDYERLVIGCLESTGNLDPFEIFDGIRRCLTDSDSSLINFEETGIDTDLGNFLAFSKCQSLYLGVARGSRAMICGTLSVSRQQRRAIGGLKNLHVWIGDPGDFPTSSTATRVPLPVPSNESTVFLKVDQDQIETGNLGDPKLLVSDRIVVDLEMVPYVSSAGVRSWLNWVRELRSVRPMVLLDLEKVPPVFSKLSLSVVGMIPDGAVVRSFFICFACPNCDQMQVVLQVNEREPSASEKAAPQCTSCKSEMELDTLPEVLSVVRRHAAQGD